MLKHSPWICAMRALLDSGLATQRNSIPSQRLPCKEGYGSDACSSEWLISWSAVVTAGIESASAGQL